MGSDYQYHEDSAESLPGMVRRHDRDLYHGNSKPGLTTRMAQAEDAMVALQKRQEQDMEQIDERCDKADKRQGRIEAMFWALILLALSILGGVITDIARGKR